MATTRPGKVNQNDLNANGKLYSESEIRNILNQIKRVSNNDPNIFIPRTKIDIGTKKGNFSVTQMDGEVYAIYYGERMGKHLGRGAFGKVKLAQNLRTGEWSAIKIIKFNDVTLQNEIKLNNKVNHNTRQLYSRDRKEGKQGKRYEFIMTLASGAAMDSIFNSNQGARSDALSLDDRLRAAIAMNNAYRDLHKNGILHCDVKLENLFYDKKSEKVTVLDFGLSLEKGPDGNVIDTFRGSPFSNPPEIKKNQRNNIFNEATDIYGIGVAMSDIFGYQLKPRNMGLCRAEGNSRYDAITPNDPNDPREVKLVNIINSTISENPNNRPTLDFVYHKLNQLVQPVINANVEIKVVEKPQKHIDCEQLSALITAELTRLTADKKKYNRQDNKVQLLEGLLTKLSTPDDLKKNEITDLIHLYKTAAYYQQTSVGRLFKTESKATKFAKDFEIKVADFFNKYPDKAPTKAF